MPEIFEVKDRDFANWFIIHGITELDKAKELSQQMPLTVSLTINGVELPVRQTLNDWGEKLDEYINKRAEELLQNNGLYDIMHNLERAIYNKAEELGLKPRKDDE